MLDRLTEVNSAVISQKKEWGEILTGFEMKNKYAISSAEGKELYFAAEVAGNILARLLLKHRRPWEIQIVDTQGQSKLILKKPFRWFFDELDILDSQGQRLGQLIWQFQFLKRIFSVRDASGHEIYKIAGPVWRPWTFRIKKANQEVGKIVKKFSGIGKELFTAADNFSVAFPNAASLEHKTILLGAVFLIDFNYFERRN